ncbi:MAG: hypothetical protein ACI9E5_001449 [Candidatus Omnitrophota bacterium]|jgi:uncharacterized protein (DUF1015 family)
MATIKPFDAVFYNINKVKDYQLVMAPPYDVINEEYQTELHNRSPYNFTQIDLAKEKSEDTASDNRYTRANVIFDQWLKEKIMIKDKEPGIYVYRQEYKVQGEKHNRLGFVALMELPNAGESKVHPHEKTHANAVNDRLELTKALNSNLSCIFVCYSDVQRKVEAIFNKQLCAQEPLIDVVDENDVRNKVWRLTDKDAIADISASLDGQNLFIADGHHRYQVAGEYRQHCIEQKGSTDGTEPFNYVMTYFTNMDSKDLQIFPMHRIMKKFPEDIEFLEEFFRIDKVKTKEELLILLAKAGQNEHAFGLYTKQGIKLLRLKNKTLIEKHIKEGTADYKKLDATILKTFVFDRLGIPSDDNIVYTKDLSDIISMVDQGKADAGFVMNAVKIQQLKDIALNGERMPPKTTYFYPKVLSGLTVYKMD